MKVLVLIDGEHYPSVTRWGVQAARARGHDVLAALLLGGSEKIGRGGLPDIGVPVLVASGDLRSELAATLDRVEPEAVLDLSDEPVLGYRERMGLVAVSLARGVTYLGPDFAFEPPVTGPPLDVPTVAVIGTGKRTGKTAVAGQLARAAAAAGRNPVVVAMGRGGPPRPQVAEAGTMNLGRLLELDAEGHHAASDYLEDAVTTGVTTVGARRVGGGLAGSAFATNVREAAVAAQELGAGVVVLEGSGSAVPPLPWDAGILVVPASAPPEYLGGYLGPYRLLLADLVVITMASGPEAGPENLSALESQVHRWHEDARVVVTDFEPVPLGDVRGRSVFLATTAPGAVVGGQVRGLQETYGCRVVGTSARLADRAGLGQDMDQAAEYEVLLTELKAAAVDVACRRAMARGAEVVFLDNRAVPGSGGDLDGLLVESVDLAIERAQKRGSHR